MTIFELECLIYYTCFLILFTQANKYPIFRLIFIYLDSDSSISVLCSRLNKTRKFRPSLVIQVSFMLTNWQFSCEKYWRIFTLDDALHNENKILQNDYVPTIILTANRSCKASIFLSYCAATVFQELIIWFVSQPTLIVYISKLRNLQNDNDKVK